MQTIFAPRNECTECGSRRIIYYAVKQQEMIIIKSNAIRQLKNFNSSFWNTVSIYSVPTTHI